MVEFIAINIVKHLVYLMLQIFVMVCSSTLLNAIPLWTHEKAKACNTGSLKHVTETLKNAEKIPRPSGDLIPCNMKSRLVPEEPHIHDSSWTVIFTIYGCNSFCVVRSFVHIDSVAVYVFVMLCVLQYGKTALPQVL